MFGGTRYQISMISGCWFIRRVTAQGMTYFSGYDDTGRAIWNDRITPGGLMRFENAIAICDKLAEVHA